MSLITFFVLSFFPRDVFDEILDLIESVSEARCGVPLFIAILVIYINTKISKNRY